MAENHISVLARHWDPRRLRRQDIDTVEEFSMEENEFPPLTCLKPVRQIDTSAPTKAPSKRWSEVVKTDLDDSAFGFVIDPFKLYLFSLPFDLQEKILEYYLCDTFDELPVDVALYDHCPADSAPRFLPRSIANFGPRLNQEMKAIFLSHNSFKIRSYKANQWFKSCLVQMLPNGRGFESIRDLRFTSFHMFPGVGEEHFTGIKVTHNADIELMTLCPSLREVLLSVHIADVVNDDATEPLTFDGIMDFFDLHNIFDCGALKKITLAGIDNHAIAARCSSDPVKVLEDFAKWLADQFQGRKKQKVKVNVTWRCGRYWNTYD